MARCPCRNASSCLIGSKSPQIWTTLGQIRKFDRHRSILGRIRADLCRFRPSLVQSRPHVGRLRMTPSMGRMPARIPRNCGGFFPERLLANVAYICSSGSTLQRLPPRCRSSARTIMGRPQATECSERHAFCSHSPFEARSEQACAKIWRRLTGPNHKMTCELLAGGLPAAHPPST